MTRKGYLILNGGEAFKPEMRAADRVWVDWLRTQHRPRAVVIPIAALEKHQKIAYEVTRYFRGMDTNADYKLVTDKNAADARDTYQTLDKVEIIVLPDGSPIRVVTELRGTHTEKVLRQALLRKAAVYGTAASAMALCERYWFAHKWPHGLNLLPGVALLPHYNVVAGRLPPAQLLAKLPEGVTLVGLDQHTNLIWRPDDVFEVRGQGAVTIYRSAVLQDRYEDGDTFTLELPSSPQTEPGAES